MNFPHHFSESQDDWVSPRVQYSRRFEESKLDSQEEIVSTNIAEMSARNTDIDLDMDGIPLSSKVKLLTQELELANRRAAESEFRMKEAIQRADFEKQRSYALDLGIQMREDRFLLFLVSIYTYPPRNPTKA